MVAKKRLRHGGDSNPDCFETRHEDQPMSSSPLRRMHDDDVSGMEAMFRRRKQLSPSSNSNIIWTKNDELIILGSIVDYEKETKLSYRSDWDAFYGYIKYFIEASFSKKQLTDKIRNLNKRFLDNKARSNDGKEPSFTDNDDDEIFKLSMIIWDTNEAECASDENIDQAKDVHCVEHERVDENMDQANVDVPCVEHERANENMDQAKDVPYVEHERVNENLDQEKVVRSVEHEQVNENIDQGKDVPYGEHEPVSENKDKENVDVPYAEHEEEIHEDEKEKSEENGVDEICALQDALEATTLFQSLGRYQQKLLLQNLKNLGAQRRKELTDEWKALLAEDMKLYAKKLTLSAKLAKAAGDSS